MTEVKENITTLDDKDIMSNENVEDSKEESEEEEESFWDFLGRVPYFPFLFH